MTSYYTGFPTKIQLIKRKTSEQYYINLPSAVAQALEFASSDDGTLTVAQKRNDLGAQDRGDCPAGLPTNQVR